MIRRRELRGWLVAIAALSIAILRVASAQTTAAIPGYQHVDGLVGAKVTDGTRTAHVTGTSLDVNCTSGCAGSGGGAASLSTNYQWSGSAWVRVVGDETNGTKVNITNASIVTSVSGSVAVTGPLTDAQLRAAAVPVSGTFWQSIQPTSNANIDVALSSRLKPSDTLAGVTTVGSVTSITNALPAGSNTIGKVDQGAAGLSPWLISASSLPLPAGAAQDATLTNGTLRAQSNVAQVAGWPVQTGAGNSGPGVQRVVVSRDSFPTNTAQENGGNLAAAVTNLAATVSSLQALVASQQALLATQTNGQQVTQVSSPPLNPFLQRCNPVRRTNCQP